eukprot:GHVN01015607.1.p1 GENE.GHVN01015607.1~~GHVN01015607.1.p1  ORF type:complete len:278 (+),score=114.60 GHVN01015607.1:33-836(+)
MTEEEQIRNAIDINDGNIREAQNKIAKLKNRPCSDAPWMQWQIFKAQLLVYQMSESNEALRKDGSLLAQTRADTHSFDKQMETLKKEMMERFSHYKLFARLLDRGALPVGYQNSWIERKWKKYGRRTRLSSEEASGVNGGGEVNLGGGDGDVSDASDGSDESDLNDASEVTSQRREGEVREVTDERSEGKVSVVREAGDLSEVSAKRSEGKVSDLSNPSDEHPTPPTEVSEVREENQVIEVGELSEVSEVTEVREVESAVDKGWIVC